MAQIPKIIDRKQGGSKADAPGRKFLWVQHAVLGAACALVIGIYMYAAHSGGMESSVSDPANTYYNVLVQGFCDGHLSLKREIPLGLAQLTDPYDPTANVSYRSVSYRLHDLSYYKGRLYLYHGVTPALVLFWPFVAVTGCYLFHRQAVVVFCGIGFLASAALLRALWRRYFAEVSIVVVAICALALGLATAVPVILARCEVYEVPISCGYMLTMLALGAIWCALHKPEGSCRWLAAASTIYGLAVGARPNLLFGAVVLLVPIAQAWRERRRVGPLLIAATVPMTLIGVGLMGYNLLRFDSPFEFGARYQLAGEQQLTRQFFSLRYLWFNFRIYFLEPVRWSGRFPFVHEATLPLLPSGHGVVEHAFGVLTNVPLVWLALAAPLAWRGRSGQARSALRWFVMAVALLFGTCALTVGLFWSAMIRYEVEFLPALVLLAVVGIFGLERTLADWLAWKRTGRCVWVLLLGFSVAFNLLASVGYLAETENEVGRALEQSGRVREAIGHYEDALRIKPDYALAHYNIGMALLRLGRQQEAVEHSQQALRLKPDYAEAHNSLGIALMGQGRLQEAIGHYQQALRIKPDFAEAHNNLGLALARAVRVQEAIGHYEQALHLNPDFAEAHYNLALALEQTGRRQEAIGQYEQAIRIKPDFAEAQSDLARARAAQ